MKYLMVVLVVLMVIASGISINTIYPVFPVLANTTNNLSNSLVDNWQEYFPVVKSGVIDSQQIMVASVSEAVGGIASGVGEWVASMVKKLIDFGGSIAENWRSFLSGKKPAVDNPIVLNQIDENLDDRIKAEVDKAVQAKLDEINNQRNTNQQSQGLVLVPSVQQGLTAKEIAENFSDEVEVYPDAGGTSGVIVPVFRDRKGEPYVYFMTPLNR